jgi:bla regulator protein BlaR1
VTFEVASIRQCRDDTSSEMHASPGWLGITCWPLRHLIEDAYEVFASGKFDPRYPLPYAPIEGIPDWVKSRSARYSIVAKAESPETQATMRGPMMQALLEDRFHLRIRSVTRDVPAYLMTVGERGPNLTVAKPGTCEFIDRTELSKTKPDKPDIPFCIAAPPVRKGARLVYDVRGISLDVFAKTLRLDRPVIDQTGLTGAFDIHLEWIDEEATPTLPDGIPDLPNNNLVVSIRKQLGLRLVRGNGPQEILVIDHIDRPSDN